MYYSYRQMGGRLPVQTVTLLARTSGAPGASATALRAAVREADDRLVADAVMPLEQRLLTSLARPRLYAVLLGGFAGCALVIAAVGLFGVLSYSVSLRTREIAIRAALGASRRERLVLGQGWA
jgi:ABC-type antimicrobial peptide transport system permease subunit